MSKIHKIIAFQCVSEALDKNDYKTANAIMEIISKSVKKDKKNNIISNMIELNGIKEEKYFKNYL